MKKAVLIRSKFFDEDCERLIDEIKSFSDIDIYVISENYKNEFFDYEFKSDIHIELGGGFLKENGLPFFSKVGWQCGDFIYYAASNYLPDYDAFWLIESDVSIKKNLNYIFSENSVEDFDFVIHNFSKKNDKWMWFDNISKYLMTNDVYGGLFPVTFLRKKFIQYLLEERKCYSKWFFENDFGYEKYANDESFVATFAKKSNINCKSLEEIFDKKTLNYFTLFNPIHKDELDFISDALVHPVCSSERASNKIKKLSFESLVLRRNEFLSRVKDISWESYSGIPDDIFEKYCFNSFLPKQLMHFFDVSFNLEGLSIKKKWIYRNNTFVIDLVFRDFNFAFDISCKDVASSGMVDLSIVFRNIVPEKFNGKSKIQTGPVFLYEEIDKFNHMLKNIYINQIKSIFDLI